MPLCVLESLSSGTHLMRLRTDPLCRPLGCFWTFSVTLCQGLGCAIHVRTQCSTSQEVLRKKYLSGYVLSFLKSSLYNLDTIGQYYFLSQTHITHITAWVQMLLWLSTWTPRTAIFHKTISFGMCLNFIPFLSQRENNISTNVQCCDFCTACPRYFSSSYAWMQMYRKQSTCYGLIKGSCAKKIMCLQLNIRDLICHNQRV